MFSDDLMKNMSIDQLLTALKSIVTRREASTPLIPYASRVSWQCICNAYTWKYLPLQLKLTTRNKHWSSTWQSQPENLQDRDTGSYSEASKMFFLSIWNNAQLTISALYQSWAPILVISMIGACLWQKASARNIDSVKLLTPIPVAL